MVRLLICLFWLASGCWANSLEVEQYSLEDLERMAKNKEWGRAVLNLKDIPKVDQNIQWKNLVERAAVGYVTELKNGGFTEVEKLIQDLVREYPSLRESISFNQLKTDIYLEAYQKCFAKIGDIPDCAKTATSVVKDRESSFDLRQKLAALVVSKSQVSLGSLCEVFLELKELSGFYQKNCKPKKSIPKLAPK